MADEEVVIDEAAVARAAAEAVRGAAIVSDALAVIRAQNENVKIGLALVGEEKRAALQAEVDGVVIGK